MQELIENLGFEKNTKVINGFRPHYKKGNDFLFIIGADYCIGKICDIDIAFKDHTGNIYGVLTDKSPRAADKDWITVPNFTLLKLNPLSKAQWAKDKMSVEYVNYTLS